MILAKLLPDTKPNNGVETDKMINKNIFHQELFNCNLKQEAPLSGAKQIEGPNLEGRWLSIFVSLIVVVLALWGSSAGCGSDNDPSSHLLPLPGQLFVDVSPAEANLLIQDNISNGDFIIIDLRTPGEYDTSHIENAINQNFYSPTFNTDIDTFDKNKIYLIYCQSGNRSGQALPIMVGLGFKTIYDLSGGISQWQRDRYPVI